MLETLFDRGIALVTTSNYAPDDLLPNPLFHEAFVPTIELMKSRMRIVRVDGPVDYRGTTSAMQNSAIHRFRASGFAAGSWTVAGSTKGFTFAELCDTPKSTGDYLAMIQTVDILTITEVPRLEDAHREAVQRFSNLVDVVYDADLRTDFYSPVRLEELAVGCTGLDIERIESRLRQLKDNCECEPTAERPEE